MIPQLTKPLIGAVNGVAITGGLELVLACDFLVASERARFADTHARMGIMPGWGLTYELPAAVGLRRARQMSATGNFVDAATALTWGLVNHVVPHAELMEFTRRLAADAASNDPAAVRAISLHTVRSRGYPAPRPPQSSEARTGAGTAAASTGTRWPAAGTRSSSAGGRRLASPDAD